METIINHVIVKVQTLISYDRDVDTKYRIILELPLPGGKAVYEIHTTKEIVENIEKAAKLCP